MIFEKVSMSEVVSQFQELIATRLWLPLSLFILLGIIFGIIIMNVLNEKNKVKKDGWFISFSCGMILFGLIWITNPNMLDDVGILATFVVALLTFRTLNEMQATRISQTRPHIIVDIDMKPARPLFEIRIKNVGNGVGYNFTSKWTPELVTASGTNFSEMELLKKIEYLPPNKELISLFDSTITYFQTKPPLPRMYNVKVTYQDENDIKFTETFIINLSVYEGIHYTYEKTLKHVVAELEKINKNLSSRTR